MVSQGLWGALVQFWTIEEKPRLDRRNSYFHDHQPSNTDALKFGLALSIIATAIVIFWSLMGVLL